MAEVVPTGEDDQDWSGMIRTGEEWSCLVKNNQDLSEIIRTGKE